jgi:hypothetical protein
MGIFYVVIIQHVMISFPFCTPIGRAIVSFQTILRLFLFFFLLRTNLSAWHSFSHSTLNSPLQVSGKKIESITIFFFFLKKARRAFEKSAFGLYEN